MKRLVNFLRPGRIGGAVRRRAARLWENALRPALLRGRAFLRRNAWPAALAASLGVSAVCSGILFYRLDVLPKQSDRSASDARSLFRASSSSAPQSSSSPAGSAAGQEYSFSALRAVNPDVKGWITIPGTAVDYPVLCPPSGQPDYYLTHDWERSETKYGSIFQYGAASGQKNVVLYGHSMKDGRMFAPLLQYTDAAFYGLHPTVRFQIGSDAADWKIFAVIKANTDPSQGVPFDYQKTRFASTKSLTDFLGGVRARSVLSLPVDVKPSDSLLTLSTCSYEFEGFRTVVFARRARPGESAAVNVAEVSRNADALYPDCWYGSAGKKQS